MPRAPKPNPLDHLSTEWFDNSGLGAKDEVKADLSRARDGFKRLHRILLKQFKTEKFTDYDTPAWQYKLAHDNGRNEILEYVLKLIDPIVRNELNDR